MIKPDLVDYGGNAVWDGPTSKVVSGGSKTSAGIWAFHHEPITRLFRTRSGTSFAAPIVAHKAASLLAAYPGAPASFLRSMLALSADLTEPAYELLASIDKTAPMMVSGHGVANVESAATSDDSRVVFYVNDELALDRFAVYELPVPRSFQLGSIATRSQVHSCGKRAPCNVHRSAPLAISRNMATNTTSLFGVVVGGLQMK